MLGIYLFDGRKQLRRQIKTVKLKRKNKFIKELIKEWIQIH
jgi:hypothetical protein